MATPDDDVGRALRLCLSSLLVKFMKAGPTAPRDGEEKRIGRGVPSRMLADRAAELAQGWPSWSGARPPAPPAPVSRATRARSRSGGGQRGAGAVVTAVRRDLRLRRDHDARFLWLGCREKKFHRVQLGARAERVGDVSAPPWREEQAQFMARSPASCGPAATRCWSWATASWTAVPKRARRHRGRGRGVGPRGGGARLAGAPAARSRGAEDLRRSTRREHLLLLKKTFF